ncbi:MAG: 3-oxoacid CoA-transferase [Pseudohongiellaceae bacterium]
MKVVAQISLTEAATKVSDGDTLIVGGFGMTGNPVHLLNAIAETSVKNLTYIGNNVGEPGLGGGRLLRNGQLTKAIGSFFTSNPEAVKAAQTGKLDVELLPQGTLCEAMRAGGAGLGGFFTPTSAGTVLAEGRESRNIGGKDMVLIPPLYGDVALIRAWKADTAGNLQYRMTENNFNQSAATAATVVIAEVEEIVPVGELNPNFIHTQGCFVDYLVEAPLTLEDLGSSASVPPRNENVDESRMNIARTALAELSPGDVVNLGIGIPTLLADLITPLHGIFMHTENGMLGVGPRPDSGGAMDFPVNAGKMPISELPGASYFDSCTSFGMIRGGHVDVSVIGGLEVDEAANLANWAVPGKPLLGVGGAMDLSSGSKRLIVTMTHTSRDGAPKIVPSCELPLTALGVVDVVITELAMFRFIESELVLAKVMPGSNLQEIQEKTSARYRIALEE